MRLTEIHKELKGSCEIVDNDSDAYITLSMDKYGHMSIWSNRWKHEEHLLKFKYNSDNCSKIVNVEYYNQEWINSLMPNMSSL